MPATSFVLQNFFKYDVSSCIKSFNLIIQTVCTIYQGQPYIYKQMHHAMRRKARYLRVHANKLGASAVNKVYLLHLHLVCGYTEAHAIQILQTSKLDRLYCEITITKSPHSISVCMIEQYVCKIFTPKYFTNVYHYREEC